MKKLILIFTFILALLSTNHSFATVYIKKGTYYRQAGSENPSQNTQTQTFTCIKSEQECLTANVNNGQTDTVLCIAAHQMNLEPNHYTTVSVNGSTVASGHCLSIIGREAVIPEQPEPVDEIDFVFQQ